MFGRLPREREKQSVLIESVLQKLALLPVVRGSKNFESTP